MKQVIEYASNEEYQYITHVCRAVTSDDGAIDDKTTAVYPVSYRYIAVPKNSTAIPRCPYCGEVI